MNNQQNTYSNRQRTGSGSSAIKHLVDLKVLYIQNRYPNFPTNAFPQPKYEDRTANGLTRCIVDFIKFSGGFATRLSSTGTYRADLSRFIPSQQRAGLPDVMTVFNGQVIFVEVKIGRDRLSSDQKEAIADLERAGASVFIARTFQSFYDWFTAQFLTAPFA